LAFKALLLFDVLQTIRRVYDIHPNMRIMCLPPTPPHCWSLWIKGIIAAFKAAYPRRTMNYYSRPEQNGEGSPTLTEFWKGYNILYAVEGNVVLVRWVNSNSGGTTLSKQLRC
jgi:hypothetical protein